MPAYVYFALSIFSAMAPRLFSLRPATSISVLIIVASFISIAAGKHTKIKSDVLVLDWHDIVNSTDFLVLRGPGSASLTPLTAPFGSILVANDPITERDSHRHVGTAKGTFITTSFDGFTFLFSFTVSLNYEKYLGSVSLLGLFTANQISKIPIVGGTGDFLFAQGYLVYTPPKNSTTFDLKLPVDLHVYWPFSISHESAYQQLPAP